MCARQVKQDCSRYLVARWSKSGINSSNIAVATGRNVDYAIKLTDTNNNPPRPHVAPTVTVFIMQHHDS